jgi:hypothetical protein
MNSQRLNRYSNKFTRTHPAYMRRTQILNDRPIQDKKTGFIQHPAGFPIEVKRKRFWEKVSIQEQTGSRIGLMFDSEEYIKPGTIVEITIPLPDKSEQFTGKVVLVRQVGECFEIGLWLLRQEDASRARIVEQICHIEVYMQEKKYREGPYNLNPDRVAREWISKYASEVPSL